MKVTGRSRTRYGRVAVLRAAVLVFLLTGTVVVGVALMLDRNARQSNAQQARDELRSSAHVAASTFATVRANLRAQAGQLASSLPLQRALITDDRSALHRIARATNSRIVVRGRSFGTLPPEPRLTSAATIDDGRRFVAHVQIGVRLDDQLLTLLAQATPLPSHAGLILVRNGR